METAVGEFFAGITAAENLDLLRSELAALPAVKDNQKRLALLTINGNEIWRPAQYITNLRPADKQALSGSDAETLEALVDDENFVRFETIQQEATQEKSGGFFKGIISNEAKEVLDSVGIDLSRYQIFTYGQLEEDEAAWSINCLWHALTLYDEDIGLSAVCSSNAKLSGAMLTRTLKTIADTYNLLIILTSDRGDNSSYQRTQRYGRAGSTKVVNLGLIRGHYFLNEKVFPTFKEIDEVVLNICHYAKTGKLTTMFATYHSDVAQTEFTKRRGLPKTIYQLVKALDRGGYIVDIPDDLVVMSNNDKPFFDETTRFIPMPSVKHPKSEPTSTPTVYDGCWYGDFETTTDGAVHKPYLAAAIKRDGHGRVSYYDITNPAKGLLNGIVKETPGTGSILVYFHNLAYDSNFLIHCLTRISTVEANCRMFSLSGNFYGRRIVCHDSYAFLTCKLQEFSKMFHLKENKFPDFTYAAYTTEAVVLNKPAKPIPNEYLLRNGLWDMNGYATDYCLRDCEVLQKGFDRFRADCLDALNIDVDALLSAASLAKTFLMKEGCLDLVLPLTGACRAYVQLSVVGGRVMLANNQNAIHHIASQTEEELLDVDGVSLYPSAMHIMAGFPTGAPRRFEGQPPPDAVFHVSTVVLTTISRPLNFPTLSVKTEEGGRQWGDEVFIGRTFILNNVQIEDAINFQGAKFSYVGGLAWFGWNSAIKTTIRRLFDWRLKLKDEGNPLQIVIKLIMNSGYGKLVEKPHETGVRWIYAGERKALQAACKAGVGLKYLQPYGEEKEGKRPWKLCFEKYDFKHASYSHAGSLTLAISKRLMYQAMVPVDAHILYTDTDSLHITREGYDHLCINYPQLIGKQMGQLHDDFVWADDEKKPKVKSQVFCKEAVYLAKKVYACVLVTSDRPGETKYHIRAKGIPTSSIRYTAALQNITPLELYVSLINKEIEFDLLEGGNHCRFKQQPTSIRSLTEFSRWLGPFAPPEETKEKPIAGKARRKMARRQHFEIIVGSPDDPELECAPDIAPGTGSIDDETKSGKPCVLA